MGVLRKRQQKLANKDLAAEEKILDNLFYDIYKNRGRIYRTNFWRGIFFGLGSVLGATLVITIVVSILSLLVQIPGGPGDFFNWVIETIRNR